MSNENEIEVPSKELIEEYQRIVREMKWQETELTNHRISWMVTFHSLLVAAVAFAWDKPNANPLLIGFTVAGILVSISSWLSLHIGGEATENLKTWWNEHGPKDKIAPPFVAFDAPKAWHWFPLWLILPWHFWPMFSAVGWLLILVYVLNLPSP